MYYKVVFIKVSIVHLTGTHTCDRWGLPVSGFIISVNRVFFQRTRDVVVCYTSNNI